MNQPDCERALGTCLSKSDVLLCLGFGCGTARQRKGRRAHEGRVTPSLGRWGGGRRVTPRVALDTSLETTRGTRPHARVRETWMPSVTGTRTGNTPPHAPCSILAPWSPGTSPLGLWCGKCLFWFKAELRHPPAPQALTSGPSQGHRWARRGVTAPLTPQNC